MTTKTDEPIIPPFLNLSVKSFTAVCEAMPNPLMIVGDTGTGKGYVFLREFERHFLEKKPDAKIRRVNVAMIPETLIEDALFGHDKGAFTGAIKERIGLVENHDLLILEEIGTLPQHVQAKLLTFIEDKKYYRVGGDEEKDAKDIQIVATTNMKTIATNSKEEGFRLDFWSRFFKFDVDPLHKRRLDILHHFADFAPETFRELRPWETMTLLCYHWPGNVRELKTLAMEIEVEKRERPEGPLVPWHTRFHEALIGTQTGLSWDACTRFRNSLRINGIDVDFLEKALNHYGLGLDMLSKEELFRKGDPACLAALAEVGLRFFADLFFKNAWANKNLLADRTDYQIPIGTPNGIGAPRINKKKLIRLTAACLRYIGMDVRGKLPNVKGVLEFLTAIGMHNPDPIPAPEAKTAGEEKTLQTRDECLRSYYTGLLNYTGGNVSEATRISGDDKRTMYKYLKKYGLK